ncbi:MAG: YajQ family cyclic di-GMP-binding protein [Negativicoccus succinicivorans]|uniref:YajQ family cyclic di-GMP-binding protein n=1 Tax=Negativicoccus succinicivorans TaxID=620903 RepID=UPI00290AC050|nr:YajQ family cyclic di-GMP-binding protein [Negativicoccus succinicivorans]MDU5396275.1 YajQ family cyclic di-GMP-binding protein [Negativicoccus succinicivorans]
MAKEYSFDVVSTVDLQEVINAVQQARKEITTRYDFRNSKSELTFADDTITLVSDDEYKLGAVQEVLRGKLVKRGVSLKNLDEGKIVPASGGTVRQEWKLKQGLDQDNAKKITKLIKDRKLKVNAQIMADQVRVTGKDKDTLQEVIAVLKATDFPVDLQFVNYR